MHILWFFPTAGDGHYLGTTEGSRTSDIHYLKQIAHGLDYLGYDGALLPTGSNCEDSWVIASALASVTNRLKFLIALRASWPNCFHPADLLAAYNWRAARTERENCPVSIAAARYLLRPEIKYDIQPAWAHCFRPGTRSRL